MDHQLNEVQNFLLEGLGIRGAIVRLEETWRQVLAPHHYPDDLCQLLGESLAATVLLDDRAQRGAQGISAATGRRPRHAAVDPMFQRAKSTRHGTVARCVEG